MTNTKRLTTKKAISFALAIIIMLSTFSGMSFNALAKDKNQPIYSFSGYFEEWNEYKHYTIPVESPRDYSKVYRIEYTCENYKMKVSVNTGIGTDDYQGYEGYINLFTDETSLGYSVNLHPITTNNEKKNFKRSMWTYKVYDITPETNVVSVKRNGKSLKITWNNAGVTGYKIVGGYENRKWGDCFYTTGTEFTITNIDEYCNYQFKIYPYYELDANTTYYFKPTNITTSRATKVKPPKATSIKSLKAGKKSFKLTVKTIQNVAGYQIQYGTKKNFKGAKSVNIKATKKTIKKLKKNKKYYVRVRTFKVVNGKKVYSKWSAKKVVKTK